MSKSSIFLFITLILLSGCRMNKNLPLTSSYSPAQSSEMKGRFWELSIMLKSATTNIDEVWSNIQLPIMPITMDIPRQNAFTQPEEIVLKYSLLSWADMQRIKESLFQTGQVEYVRLTQINQQ